MNQNELTNVALFGCVMYGVVLFLCMAVLDFLIRKIEPKWSKSLRLWCRRLLFVYFTFSLLVIASSHFGMSLGRVRGNVHNLIDPQHPYKMYDSN